MQPYPHAGIGKKQVDPGMVIFILDTIETNYRKNVDYVKIKLEKQLFLLMNCTKHFCVSQGVTFWTYGTLNLSRIIQVDISVDRTVIMDNFARYFECLYAPPSHARNEELIAKYDK